jgi:hypothetical protein
MRPLLYHTVQDGAGPRLDHAPLALSHSAGRCWPTFGPCTPCSITQFRTVFAHISAMLPLLHHAVQNDAGPHLDHAPFTVPHPALHCNAGDVILHKQDLLHTTQDRWQGYIRTDTASCHYQMAQHFTFTVTQFQVRLQAICWSMLLRLARLQFSMSQERTALRLARGHSLSFSFTCAVGVTHSRTDRQTDRQTYESRNIGPAVSRGSAATERNADCYIRNVHTGI